MVLSARRAVVTVLATTLSTSLASGCAPSGRGDAIEWKPCGASVDLAAAHHPAERSSRLVVSCAAIAVPLAEGSDTSIAVQLLRVQLREEGTSATAQPEPKEPLLLIAGGPGQSGVDWTASAAGFLPLPLLERFDLVGFDPRGVGRSSPIRCRHPKRPELPLVDLASAAGYDLVAEGVRRSTEECLAALGETAPHFNTTQTAADLEAIREALAVDTLTYAGWSYGAKLGAEYARQHPDRVRAAVLDAPSDPTVDWLDPLDQQVAGFEDSFDRFASWCEGRPECAPLGDVRAYTAALVARAEQTPIPSLRPGDTEPTGGVEVVQGVVMALYDDARWPDLALGLGEAEAGDSGTLRSFGDELRGDAGDSNSADAHFVIECNDSLPQPGRAEVVAMARGLEERHPLFGRWASAYLLACASWTPERHPLEARPAPTPRPVVVVGTLHDPATPYAGAVELTGSLGTATLVTWEGEGHTAFGRDDCVNEVVTRYLVDLTAPAAGTRCPP